MNDISLVLTRPIHMFTPGTSRWFRFAFSTRKKQQQNTGSAMCDFGGTSTTVHQSDVISVRINVSKPLNNWGKYYRDKYTKNSVTINHTVNGICGLKKATKLRHEYFCTEHIWRDHALIYHYSHNERDGDSNHRRLDCLLNRLFIRRPRKTSKPRVTGLCEGNSPVTGEFPAPRPVTHLQEHIRTWWKLISCTHHTSPVGIHWQITIRHNHDWNIFPKLFKYP